MKKRFITTAAMAAITATMLLNGCGSSQTASTSAPQTETQAPSTEAKPDETEETTAAPETGGSETEALAEDVVRTEAVYVKDSEFAEDGRLVFHNDTHGDFICNISDFTVLPEELKDGETYVISHSMVMTCPFPDSFLRYIPSALQMIPIRIPSVPYRPSKKKMCSLSRLTEISL